MTLHFYGIPNCDTVRKARAWLDANGQAYVFHDYKKEGADQDRLRGWVQAVGWEKLLNRKGTSFRKLEPAQKEGLDDEKAIRLMAANPSMIRRPVVESEGGLLVGFDEAQWSAQLG
ncbi:Spx/MgsR family RNA polymerase-binding regulatory protein [Altererythrobacter aerius]|uniref:Spx/MgsR family RNA polymerase-binding regulatory protein n=1 Tax=Tsuneonella aeria TaxID=1837929 RepID=A0A6I4TI41_9SPHN|nr:arsenate reductase [Tsuneonella aeria]MXO75710.1 Spx/MgsR family RNA polymerase-binding regulatory protein [Tsuneonella aeria]